MNGLNSKYLWLSEADLYLPFVETLYHYFDDYAFITENLRNT